MKNSPDPDALRLLDLAAGAARAVAFQLDISSGKFTWAGSASRAIGIAEPANLQALLKIASVADRPGLSRAILDAPADDAEACVEFQLNVEVGARQGRWCLLKGRRQGAAGHSGPVTFVGLLMDIHDRKSRELHSQLDALQKRALLDSLPDVVWMKNLDGRFLAVNRQFCERFGLDPARAEGKSDMDIYPPEKAEAIRKDDDRVISSGCAVRYQSSQVVNGKTYWVEVIKSPIFDAAGGVIGTVGASRDISPQRAAERAEREAADRFRMLAELSSDWFWEQDDQQRFTHFTGNSDRFGKLKLDRLIGRRRWEAEDEASIGAEWKRHKATLDAHLPFFDFEYDYRIPGGDLRRFSVSGKPTHDDQGRFSGYRGVGRDITQQVRDGIELRNVKRHLRLAQEGSHLALWDSELTTGKVYLSEEWSILLGLPEQETTTTITELMAQVHPEDLQMLLQISESVVRGRLKDYAVEHRVRSSDGNWKWIMSRGAITERGPDGKPLRMSGTNLDITERKTLEARMGLILSETEALLETSPTALAVLRNRVIVRCNRAMEHLFGATVGGLLGKSTRILFPDEHAWKKAGEEAYTAVKAGKTFRSEREFVRADGTHFWAVVAGRRIGEENADVVFSYTDVTEQQQLASALEKARDAADAASQAKSDFLATMSHEIRTPMHGVLGMLELLEMSKLDDDQRETARLARDSASALLRLIDDILDFSKIEAGQLTIHAEAISLRAIAGQTAATYRDLAQSKGLRLETIIDDNIAPAHFADGFRISQIINNLLSNAIKFTPSGRVALHIESDARTGSEEIIRVRVTDTGIGVTEEQKTRLFKPFSQGDMNTTRKYGGTGLGLSICSRLAEMMGGSISMTSAHGQGTDVTVLLQLPITSDKSLATNFESKPQFIANSTLDLGTVLVAEDHQVNMALITRQLQSLGYQVVSAADGVEALEKWKNGRYVALLTDCHMPNMDGYQLSREIRTIERDRALASGVTRRTPIIACTASTVSNNAELCRAAGMDDFLCKPISMADMRMALEKWSTQSPSGRPTRENDVHVRNDPETMTQSAKNDHDVPSDPPIDLSILTQFSGGDRSVEQEILSQFMTATSDDASALRLQIDEGDTDAISKAAHRVKSAARMIGAAPIAAIAETIEHAARDKNATLAAASMVAFDTEHARLLDFLRKTTT